MAIRRIAFFGVALGLYNAGACMGAMLILSRGYDTTVTVLVSTLAVVLILAAITSVARLMRWLAADQS